MGWKRGYYYSGGRYVGKDWIARVHAAIDADHAAINREMRDLARERRKAEREAYQSARQRAAKVDLIVTGGLEAAGFYRQQRHQWKRRKAAMKKLETNAPTTEKAAIDLAEITQTAYVRKVYHKIVVTRTSFSTSLMNSVPSCLARALYRPRYGWPSNSRSIAGSTSGPWNSSPPKPLSAFHRQSIDAAIGRGGGICSPDHSGAYPQTD